MLDKITTKNVIQILNQAIKRKKELKHEIKAKNREIQQEDIIIEKSVERLIKELNK